MLLEEINACLNVGNMREIEIVATLNVNKSA